MTQTPLPMANHPRDRLSCLWLAAQLARVRAVENGVSRLQPSGNRQTSVPAHGVETVYAAVGYRLASMA